LAFLFLSPTFLLLSHLARTTGDKSDRRDSKKAFFGAFLKIIIYSFQFFVLVKSGEGSKAFFGNSSKIVDIAFDVSIKKGR
jgi:hypothetical protein